MRAIAASTGEPPLVTWESKPGSYRLGPITSTLPLGSVAFALVLAVQLQMWLVHARVYVVPHYAGGHDQATYLARAYGSYVRLEQLGLSNGLAAALAEQDPQGMLLPNLAAIWFLFTGPGRAGALSLNFVAFVVLQVLMAAALLRATRRWAFATIGVGMIAATQTPYLTYGGLFDFRTDFVAMCGYGAVCALGVMSDAFARRWGAVCAGILAGFTILTRFATLAYFGAALFIFVVLLLWRMRWHKDSSLTASKDSNRLRNVCVSALCSIGVAGLLVAHNAATIQAYYFGRFSAAAAANLFATADASTPLEILVYYPKVIVLEHLVGAALLCVLVLAIGVLMFRLLPPHTHAHGGLDVDSWAATAVVLGSILGPLLILTLYHTKAGLLAGVVMPSIVIGAVLLFRGLIGSSATDSNWWGIQVTAAIVAGIAALSTLGQMTRTPFPGVSAADLQTIDRLETYVASQIVTMQIPLYVVASNSALDYLTPYTIQVAAYERLGILPDANAELGPLVLENAARLAGPLTDALSAADQADLLLLTDRVRPLAGLDFSFYPGLEANTPDLFSQAQRSLIEYKSYRLTDRTVTIFVKPRVRVEGVTTDGWITSAGIRLIVPAVATSSITSVLLEGSSDLQPLLAIPEVTASNAGGRIPAELTVDGSRYRISVRFPTPPQRSSDDAFVDLTFSTFFVPASSGINPDTRQLVLRAPDVVRAVMSTNSP